MTRAELACLTERPEFWFYQVNTAVGDTMNTAAPDRAFTVFRS